MNAEELKSLAHIRDVVLSGSAFVQPRDYLEYLSLHPQSRQRLDRCEVYRLVDDKGKETPMMRAICEYAIRAVGGVRHAGADPIDEESAKAVPVLFQIEASFALVYELKQDFAQEQIDTFFKRSCLHVCWPFWRQHVFDILKRASLPLISVPLMCPPVEATQGKRRGTKSKVAPPAVSKLRAPSDLDTDD